MRVLDGKIYVNYWDSVNETYVDAIMELAPSSGIEHDDGDEHDYIIRKRFYTIWDPKPVFAMYLGAAISGMDKLPRPCSGIGRVIEDHDPGDVDDRPVYKISLG